MDRKNEDGFGKEYHISILKQTLIIIGGLFILFLYKHIFRYFNRPYITDIESIIIIFKGIVLLFTIFLLICFKQFFPIKILFLLYFKILMLSFFII